MSIMFSRSISIRLLASNAMISGAGSIYHIGRWIRPGYYSRSQQEMADLISCAELL